MKITGFEIERFGVWSGLTVPKLSPGMNVFYGGNEAGKSTLMEFIRAELYGFGDQRRRFARRPGGLHGDWNADFDHEGRSMFLVSGGLLKLECPSGEFRLRRMFHPDGIEGREDVDLRTLDGSKEKAQLLRILTCGIDEGTFNNVFAIGLDELQKLGSLSDTEAAEMLFRLSVGMDRISIVDSIKELTARRNRVLDIHERDAKPSLLTRLLRRREAILEELDGAKLLVRDYVRIRNEQRDVDRTIGNLEEELAKLRREKRLYELAGQVEPIWGRRDKVRGEIDGMGAVVVVPEETIVELDDIGRRREKKQFAYDQLKEEYKRARDAIRQEPVNETLWKLAPKIEVLLDEESRIIEIDKQISAHEKDIAALENRIAEEENQIKRGRRSLLLPATKRNLFPEEFFASSAEQPPHSEGADKSSQQTLFSSPGTSLSAGQTQSSVPYAAKGHRPFLESNEMIDLGYLDDYRLPARAVHKARKRHAKARRRHAEMLGRSKVLNEKIASELVRLDVADLNDAVERTGETVNLLRRRLNVAKKLSEFAMHYKDLHRVNTALMQYPAIPVWLLVLLGICWVFGLTPTGILLFELGGATIFDGGIPMFLVVAGLFLFAGSILYKIIAEKNHARQLAENQRQMSLVMTQIEHGKQEAAAIDARLPAAHTTLASAAAAGAKPYEIRIQEAQQELANLEKLLPVDAQRREVDDKLKQADVHLERCKRALATATKRWNDWLKSSGLPDDWSPARVRDLLDHCDVVGDMKKELDFRYDSMNQRIRDMRSITDRIDLMIAETGLSFENGVSYVDILGEIRKKLAENDIALQKREKLKIGIREFRKMRKKAVADLNKVRRDELDLLRQYGAKTGEELRELHRRHSKHRRLMQQEQGVQRELDAAIGSFCEESVIANLLEPRLEQAARLQEREQLRQRRLETRFDAGAGGQSDSEADESLDFLDDRAEEIESLPGLPELMRGVQARIDSTSARLHEELERRGKLVEQLKAIAEDRTTIRKQRELAVVEEQIGKARRDWQIHAVCGRMLDTIRVTYEKERQPRTLAEASEFLRKLTEGRYYRIWTPLGEETLLVDDEQGNTFDIAWLSRGTREQLFVAIRLALVSAFAQHGSMLPIVMDDVLVNFDSKRATAAARVLLEFARSGRQIILFTCHEHVCRIFQKLDVPVRVLPSVDDPGKGLKVLLPRSILQKREKARRQEIARLSAEKNRRLLEAELAQREERIRQDTLRKAEVQNLILQMQRQATAEKAVEETNLSSREPIAAPPEIPSFGTPSFEALTSEPLMFEPPPPSAMDDYFEEDEE